MLGLSAKKDANFCFVLLLLTHSSLFLFIGLDILQNTDNSSSIIDLVKEMRYNLHDVVVMLRLYRWRINIKSFKSYEYSRLTNISE